VYHPVVLGGAETPVPVHPRPGTSGGPVIFTEIAVVIALILANGVFAGAEIAVVSLRHTRVQQLLEAKRIGAVALHALRSQPERFLATVQVGITVVSVSAAAFGGSTLSRYLEPAIARIASLADNAEEIAFALVVSLISYLSLVLGELVPKSLALRVGETYALLVARPLLALSFIARPIVWLLTTSSNVVLKPFRDRTNFMEAVVSKEELLQMVEEAGETGALHEQASELASRALEFDKLSLSEVMIPRNRIDALPINATADQVRRFLLEERRSRVPVYDGTLDNIVGYVSAKDIVALAWEGKLFVLRDLLRPVKVFPETVLAIEVLRYMRREHLRLVVAVDEHAAVSGMATFEDLVEEIVGEVFSENEEQSPPIELDATGAAIVRGDVPLREVNRALELDLTSEEGVSTIAGLCITLAGGIPHRGARLAAEGGVVLVVLDATTRGVRRVKIIPPPRPEKSEADDTDEGG
jgi:putative hemolysin